MPNHHFATIRRPGVSHLNECHPLSPFEVGVAWLGLLPLLVLLNPLLQFPMLTAPILTELSLKAAIARGQRVKRCCSMD